MGERIELLETIRSFAQGAKTDLMKVAVKENQLWQAITRYEDVVQQDVDTMRDIADQADGTNKAKHEKKNKNKKQRLAIENSYGSDGGYESSASSAISTQAPHSTSSSITLPKAVFPTHTPDRPVHKTVLSNAKVATPPS